MSCSSDQAARVKFDVPTFTVRNIDVAAIGLAQACDLIGRATTEARGRYVTVTDAHAIVESVYDKQVEQAHRDAILVLPDGMPLVWLGRLLGFSSIGRVYGPDLMECILAKPHFRQLRHFFYGATSSTVARLIAAITARWGHLNVVGTHSPAVHPTGFREDPEVLARIRASRPDILWVGLSAPKQEVWLRMHMPMTGAGIGIGVGAAFDFLSGGKTQAPRWVQRSGFEWLFRLMVEPRRLFRRYAFVIPRFSYLWVETLLQHLVKRPKHPPI